MNVLITASLRMLAYLLSLITQAYHTCSDTATQWLGHVHGYAAPRLGAMFSNLRARVQA